MEDPEVGTNIVYVQRKLKPCGRKPLEFSRCESERVKDEIKDGQGPRVKTEHRGELRRSLTRCQARTMRGVAPAEARFSARAQNGLLTEEAPGLLKW